MTSAQNDFIKYIFVFVRHKFSLNMNLNVTPKHGIFFSVTAQKQIF